jgi:hypothetical protein
MYLPLPKNRKVCGRSSINCLIGKIESQAVVLRRKEGGED